MVNVIETTEMEKQNLDNNSNKPGKQSTKLRVTQE